MKQEVICSVHGQHFVQQAPGGPPEAAASAIAAAEAPAPGGPETRTSRRASTSKEGELYFLCSS